MSKLTKQELENNDSCLIWAVKFNDTNKIKWNGAWYLVGALRKILNANPPAPSSGVKE